MLGLETSLLWDGVESAIRNETTGILRGVERTVRGEASPGEVFDTAFAFGSAGIQGYLGGKFGLREGSDLEDEYEDLPRQFSHKNLIFKLIFHTKN